MNVCCPYCSQLLLNDESTSGIEALCPACNGLILMPQLSRGSSNSGISSYRISGLNQIADDVVIQLSTSRETREVVVSTSTYSWLLFCVARVSPGEPRSATGVCVRYLTSSLVQIEAKHARHGNEVFFVESSQLDVLQAVSNEADSVFSTPPSLHPFEQEFPGLSELDANVLIDRYLYCKDSHPESERQRVIQLYWHLQRQQVFDSIHPIGECLDLVICDFLTFERQGVPTTLVRVELLWEGPIKKGTTLIEILFDHQLERPVSSEVLRTDGITNESFRKYSDWGLRLAGTTALSIFLPGLPINLSSE